jgi:ubiquinone/menaquinone biosynthesis C-methylase UbiE
MSAAAASRRGASGRPGDRGEGGELEPARDGAAAERLPVEFLEGDAENLPFPDASFDAVLSVLGVMFTADQERGAAELLRVCRPGG